MERVCIFVLQVSSGLQSFEKRPADPAGTGGRYAQQAAAEAFFPLAAAARR